MFEACEAFVWCLKDHFYAIYGHLKKKEKKVQKFQSGIFGLFWTAMAPSNQITVVAFQPVQLAQASFLQKNQMLQNGFLISVMLRWHRASVACKNQSF